LVILATKVPKPLFIAEHPHENTKQEKRNNKKVNFYIKIGKTFHNFFCKKPSLSTKPLNGIAL
jgi:hypothetical protein